MKIIIPFTKHKLLSKPEIAVETKTEKICSFNYYIALQPSNVWKTEKLYLK